MVTSAAFEDVVSKTRWNRVEQLSHDGMSYALTLLREVKELSRNPQQRSVAPCVSPMSFHPPLGLKDPARVFEDLW